MKTATVKNTNVKTEIVIVRNSISKSLYDVLEADYFKETVVWKGKALSFESACLLVEEIKAQQELVESFEDIPF